MVSASTFPQQTMSYVGVYHCSFIQLEYIWSIDHYLVGFFLTSQRLHTSHPFAGIIIKAVFDYFASIYF